MTILNNWVKNHGDKFAIDLRYLAGVFKTAKQLWQLPVIRFCTPFGERAERHNHPSCCY